MEKHVIKNLAADIVGDSTIRVFDIQKAHSNPNRRWLMGNV